MRQTSVTYKVTSSTKIQGAQHSPELGLRSTKFHAPGNLTFAALTLHT